MPDMSRDTAVLVLGDQLSWHHPALVQTDPDSMVVIFAEVSEEALAWSDDVEEPDAEVVVLDHTTEVVLVRLLRVEAGLQLRALVVASSCVVVASKPGATPKHDRAAIDAILAKGAA